MTEVLIKDFIQKKTPKGDIGIEIEVEAEGVLPSIDSTWWKTKNDNSLRGGLEYITKGALPIDPLFFSRIKSVTSEVDTKGAKILKDSHRTSVHLHHNVSQYTPVQLWTSLTAYWLLENLLFKACGKEREGNQFCLRIKDAETILLRYVKDELSIKDTPFITLDTDNIRYAAANLSAINRYGSVELRGMRGTLDPKLISDWGILTNGIFSNAKKQFKSPESLLDTYFYGGWNRIQPLLWKNTESLDFLLKEKNINDLIDENAYILSNVMYSISWDNYATFLAKKAENMKKDGLKNIPVSRRNTFTNFVPDDLMFL